MSRLVIARLLTTGSVVGATTTFRVAAGCLELLAQRTPPLVTLAMRASLGGPDTARAQATFRDEFVGLARDSAAVSWRELRRGVDQLDSWTRPPEPPEPPAPGPGPPRRTGPPRRPYRVKP
jgi:hypothetical protein